MQICHSGPESASSREMFVLPRHAAGQWFVLHTRSRQEKALSEDLGANGIAHYLPLVRTMRYYGTRKALVEMPLFPSYLFLLGSIDDAYWADRTRRVAKIISVADQDRMFWELDNLQKALQAHGNEPFDLYPSLKVGVRVEVRSGPFRGVQGVISDRTNRDRLMLQVDMLGQAVGLELHGALLSPIA